MRTKESVQIIKLLFDYYFECLLVKKAIFYEFHSRVCHLYILKLFEVIIRNRAERLVVIGEALLNFNPNGLGREKAEVQESQCFSRRSKN
jgi:hypothetical protein